MKNLIISLLLTFCTISLAGCERFSIEKLLNIFTNDDEVTQQNNHLTEVPTIETLCKHFASCETYTISEETCISNLSASAQTLFSDCKTELNALYKCQYHLSCDEIAHPERVCVEEAKSLSACAQKIDQKIRNTPHNN